MYFLIESENQLQKFLSKGYKEVFVELIPENFNTHPILGNVCLIYIRPITHKKGYIVSLNHNECLRFDLNIVELLNSFDHIWTRDKKEFLHYYQVDNLIDCSIEDNVEVKLDLIHNFFKGHPRPNTLVPVNKHYEWCQNLFEQFESNFDLNTNKFYNDNMTLLFNLIEKEGLGIDKQLFENHFYKTDSNVVYTKYNIKTFTKRPSNSFNGVNFLALNKSDGSRKAFIPKSDVFVEFDLSSYHLVIIARLIGYSFDGIENIHQHFADQYGVDYETAKQITFKQMYGNIDEKYSHIQFFSKIKEYINLIWKSFKDDGFFECPSSKWIFYDDGKLTPNKLFNYTIQNEETSQNLELIKEIIKLCWNRKSKLVLYIYDSFIFDFSYEDYDLIPQIKQIFSNRNLKFHIKKGINLDFDRE